MAKDENPTNDKKKKGMAKKMKVEHAAPMKLYRTTHAFKNESKIGGKGHLKKYL